MFSIVIDKGVILKENTLIFGDNNNQRLKKKVVTRELFFISDSFLFVSILVSGSILSAMKPSILGIGTQVPKNCYAQQELVNLSFKQQDLEVSLQQWLTQVSEKADINYRHTVIEKGPFFDRVLGGSADFEERNNLYCQEAPKLALESAKKAIDRWGGSPKEITHIVAISCTGVMAPGIEVILAKDLGLSDDVERLGVNMMGCFGAFKGFQVADAIAKEDPNHRILFVCTELCSLHYQSNKIKDRLLANLIFADGSAACIVGVPKPSDKPLWTIEKRASTLIPNSLGEMTWKGIKNHFEMTMTTQVPIQIRKTIAGFAKKLMGIIPNDKVHWAIHPGGKAILQGIEKACGLLKDQTRSSWEVMRAYGNMSSATFLFVLDHLKDQTKKPWTVGFGFGPGLSVEGILLGEASL